MVINGDVRAGPGELAFHLSRADTNERVTLRELDGVAATTLRGALLEMDAVASGARSKLPLYHANIDWRADETMTDEQKARAVQRLGEALGLADQPRAVVEHVKHGREHLHVVWLNIDPETMKAIPHSFNFRTHEAVARELEREFGHQRVQGAHVERDGIERPERCPTLAEIRQSERSGVATEDAKAQLRGLWGAADNGRSFTAALDDAGWILARGDKRNVLVALDPTGEARAVNKDITGLTAAKVRERLTDIDASRLPTVDEAREQLAARQREAEAASQAQHQAEQRAREIAKARELASQEDEKQPQKPDAKTVPAETPKLADERTDERPSDWIIARALDALAQTDPVRFAASADAAKEAARMRPNYLELIRRRDQEVEALQAAEKTASSAETPASPALAYQPQAYTLTLNLTGIVPDQAKGPREVGQQERDGAGRVVAGSVPEATQRVSYEAENAADLVRPSEIERARVVELLLAARAKLSEIAERMENAIAAVFRRHEAQTPERHPLAFTPTRTEPRALREDPGERKPNAPAPDLRADRSSAARPEPRRDFEKDRQEADRKRAELFSGSRAIDEQEWEHERERQRQRDRERHHRPFQRGIFGYVRKHHRRPHR